MIRFESVTFTYPEAPEPVLDEIDLDIPEGELCLVVGGTGSGKSTLLKAVNGLVPHFTGGTMRGRVTVNGRDTRTHPPRELADVVGFVGQDPSAGFVTDAVEDELAYGMESLGLPETVMRRRVEEILDLLGLADVRNRPLSTLSSGQQQRVALGSVLTTHPDALVLDEPTSALDPVAAEEVLAALQRLVHDLGLTVLLAEHRLERVVAYADSIVRIEGPGRGLVAGAPAEVMASSPVAPPVVELGRVAHWSPLPLSIRDARRAVAPLRERLAESLADDRAHEGQESKQGKQGQRRQGRGPGTRPASDLAVLSAHGIAADYGQVRALAGVDLDVARGTVLALMGRNGAGKSTLLEHLVGLRSPKFGNVLVLGAQPHRLRPREALRRVGLVPAEPADLLQATTVVAECAQADRDTAMPAGSCRELLQRLAPEIPDTRHPRDLSTGQRLALALTVIMVGRPPLLLLDEPTRGLDYAAKVRLVAMLRDLADAGHAVIMATHDVELIAEGADRTVVLADGEIVADGPTDHVLPSSPAFAPQMTKVFAPLPVLTVNQVSDALGAMS